MSWSKLHGGAHRHRKILRLSKALSISMMEARGVAMTIWSWTTETERDGDLSDYSADELAYAWGWDGDADALLAALVEVGLLDRSDDGALLVHEWMVYAAGWREAERSKQRRGTQNSNDSNTDLVATGSRPGRDRDATGTRPGERRGEERRRDLSPTPLASSPAAAARPLSTMDRPTWPTDICHPERWVELWNEAATKAPKLRAVVQLSGLQIAGLRDIARDEAWWRATLAQVPRSAWLRGEKRKWTPGPRWLLERGADNATKVHDGYYSDEREVEARSAIAPSTGRDPKTRERAVTLPPSGPRTPPPPEVLSLFRADRAPRAPPAAVTHDPES